MLGTEVAEKGAGRVVPDDSMRTVLVSLGAGIGVTLAKVGAAVFTGSAALAAEAAHSLAVGCAGGTTAAGNLVLLARWPAPGRAIASGCPISERR
jgi:hypothetical protein